MCENKVQSKKIIEGVDFHWEDIQGVRLRVFTKDYLRRVRVFCCQNFCKNCPWDYRKKQAKKDCFV